MEKLFFISLIIALVSVSCKKDPVVPECIVGPQSEDRVFEFRHTSSNDTFIAWTSDTSVIQEVEAQLALPIAQRTKHINGVILRMPEACKANQKWNWYFAPDGWALADLSIELCDGNPQFVEDNIDEYVDNVKRYCPWSSVVLRAVK